MIGSREFKFGVKVNWIIGISGIGLALIVAYILRPSWHDNLKFVAPVLGGTAALIAAVNAIDSRVAQGKAAKRSVAFECLKCWLNPTFYHAKSAGREILARFKDLPGVERQVEYLREQPGREANLLDVLNFFEVMAVAIRTELADEEVCKRFFQSMVTSYWHAAEGCIRRRRAERENARLFQELEWLAQKWSS